MRAPAKPPVFWESDRSKNITSAVAVGVSILSLIASSTAAYLSAQVNAKFKDREIELATEEIANELLTLSMPHFEDMRSTNDQEAEAACIVAVELSALQFGKTVAVFGAGKARRDIESILQELWARDLTNRFAYCRNSLTKQEAQVEATAVKERTSQLVVEGTSKGKAADQAKIEIQRVETDIKNAVVEAGTAEEGDVGTWHAVMASYQLQNCHLARESAAVFSAEFAEQLQDRGNRVSIYRTTISNHFAVTIDTGDTKSDAQTWVNLLRQRGAEAESSMSTAEERQNLRFLTGAFVQENRSWLVDPECKAEGQP